ncbi:hypothetical protein [Streptomyces sp. NPDC059080]|uniref:hypothetical protein n=1 Tax=Streptomyces sp. NPDC059080 TaxID=3346718 RepID=UPI0036A96918
MQISLTGTNLTRTLNEVRRLRQFSQLKAVFADQPSGLVWVEDSNGAWRLPAAFLPWAVEVEVFPDCYSHR